MDRVEERESKAEKIIKIKTSAFLRSLSLSVGMRAPALMPCQGGLGFYDSYV